MTRHGEDTTQTPMEHIHKAAQFAASIASDERYDKPALFVLVNRLLPILGWGTPRTRRSFDRWLDALDISGNYLYSSSDLQELLILSYWLSQNRRQGINLYFTEKFWRDSQQTTANAR